MLNWKSTLGAIGERQPENDDVRSIDRQGVVCAFSPLASSRVLSLSARSA